MSAPGMRSIRARFAALMAVMLTGLMLICSYAAFAQVRVYVERELQTKQRLLAEGNKSSLESFLAMVNQSGVAVVADRLIGSLASLNSTDTLEMLAARSEMNGQFYHLTSTVTGIEGYYFRSLLFMDARLPLAAYFGEATLDVSRGAMNCVYSNALVAGEPWYVTAMEKNRALHIFLSDGSLCLARKIQNNHYVGPNQADGLGVMVTRVELERLEQIFRFSQLSEHTDYCLISPEGTVLYASEPGRIGLPYEAPPASEPRALVYEDNLSWGLRLVFRTPVSDMNAGVLPLMRIFVMTYLAMALVAIALALAASRAVTRPIVDLSRLMGSIRDTRQTDAALLAAPARASAEVAQLYGSFSALLTRVNRLIADVETRTQLQKEAELKMMQAQINPHFLYNAMDSINWIALQNGQDEIVDMVSHLAALLRYSLAGSGGDVTLAQELENIQHYIALQRVRYGERVELAVEADEAALEARLPRVTLQPLLENTFHHGVSAAMEGGPIRIMLKASCEGSAVRLTLTDNGVGCDAARLNLHLSGESNVLQTRGGLGIRNVSERLRHSGGSLSYENTERGELRAVITLPGALPLGTPPKG